MDPTPVYEAADPQGDKLRVMPAAGGAFVLSINSYDNPDETDTALAIALTKNQAANLIEWLADMAENHPNNPGPRV